MLLRLRVDYLGLLPLHLPACGQSFCGPWIPAGKHVQPEESRTGLLGSWAVLEQLHAQGVVRAIGVSNFDASPLQRAQ